MKIYPLAPGLDRYLPETERRPMARPTLVQPASVTTLSTAGRMVSELRGQARVEGYSSRFRPEVVAAIRAEIGAGTFGGPGDIERTVDALLGEL